MLHLLPTVLAALIGLAPATEPPTQVTPLTSPPAAPRAGTVVVSTRGDNHIVLLNGADGSIVSRFDAGVGAHEIACSPDGRIAVGSAYGSGPGHRTPDQRLVVIDLPGRKVERLIDLGPEHPRPNDLVFYPDGRHVLCTSEVRKSLIKVDITEGKIIREYPFDAVGGHMLAVTPDFSRAFVPSVPEGRVVVLDLASGQTLGSVTTAVGSEGVACTPDGRSVWALNNRSHSISVIDAAELKATDPFKAAGFPFRIRFTPAGDKAIVSCPMAGEARVYDTASHEVLAAIPIGEQPKKSAPTSVAMAADGRRAFVVCGGVGAVAILDLEELEVVTLAPVGPGPDGLAWTPLTIEATPPSNPAAPTGS